MGTKNEEPRTKNGYPKIPFQTASRQERKMLKKNVFKEIETKIGYKFRDKDLLKKALLHRSYRFENPDIEFDNQRLEFLGDAVLGQMTAAYLFRTYEDKLEGDMTRLRSQVTSGKALAEIAGNVDLGRHLSMGRGEEQSGGRTRSSNLADSLEAVIGAAWLDGGEKAAVLIFNKLFKPCVDAIENGTEEANPKGALQEYCQRRWKSSPVYSVIKEEGPPHNMIFSIKVLLPDGNTATASARNKQTAEAMAAKDVLVSVDSGS